MESDVFFQTVVSICLCEEYDMLRKLVRKVLPRVIGMNVQIELRLSLMLAVSESQEECRKISLLHYKWMLLYACMLSACELFRTAVLYY